MLYHVLNVLAKVRQGLRTDQQTKINSTRPAGISKKNIFSNKSRNTVTT